MAWHTSDSMMVRTDRPVMDLRFFQNDTSGVLRGLELRLGLGQVLRLVPGAR